MPYPRSSPLEVRWAALFLGLLSFLAFAFTGYVLARDTLAGTAIYASGPRGVVKERVSRASDPVKYKAAMDKGWYSLAVAGSFAGLGFFFFRKLS